MRLIVYMSLQFFTVFWLKFVLIMYYFLAPLIKIYEQIQTLDLEIGNETCLEHLQTQMLTIFYFNVTAL